STHSSQMYTAPGPAISRLTWSWFLPQKEQLYCTRLPRVVLLPAMSRPLPPPSVALLLWLREEFVHQTVLPRLLGRHVDIAVRVGLDALHALTGLVGEDLANLLVVPDQFARGDLHVRGLTRPTAQRLVHVDRRVRQREPLPLLARAQQHRAHGGSHAHSDGAHVRADQVHRVVDRQPG